MAERLERIGYDAFASGGGYGGMGADAGSGGGEQDNFSEPDLGNATAQSRLYVRDRRPTSTATGQDAPPAPVTSEGPAAGSSRGAGISLLFAAAGAGIGATFGGWWGAGAGLLLAGSLRNGARARKLWGAADASQREEATSSVTMALLGGAAGGYLAYRAYRENRLES